MRRYSWIVALLAGAGLAGLGGAGCSTTASGPSEGTASNHYYRGPIGNGAFGEAVPAADREEASSARAAGHEPAGERNFVGNGAFGEAP